MRKLILIALSALVGTYIHAQDPETKSDTLRKDAGVYIISTYQPTGSGGIEITYYLVGQNELYGNAGYNIFHNQSG